VLQPLKGSSGTSHGRDTHGSRHELQPLKGSSGTPVGAISIKSVPRSHDQPAAVVSKGVLGE